MGVEAGRLALRRGRRRRHRRAVVLHRRPGLRRQDQRHHGPRRPPPPARIAGLRRQRRRALRRGRAAGHARRHRHPPRGERRPPQRPGRRPRRGRRSATPPPRWSSATAPTSPGDRRGDRQGRRHRGVPRPLAGARPGPLQGVGGALRGDPLRAARPGRLGRRAEARRARGRPGRPRGHHRHPRPGQRGARQEARRGRALRRRRSPTWSATPAPPTRPCCSPVARAPRRRGGAGGSGDRAGRARRRRRRAALPDHRGARVVAGRSARDGAGCGTGAPIDYGTYLRWRGLLPVEPPRRPEPARPSASAAGRSSDWKFGFVGSADADGEVHLPPQPGDGTAVPMADAVGTIVTSTIDRLAYSPSPPVVFAVVDFDGGGRLPVELTDVDDLERVKAGARVELTFRKLFTADDIHNYFWKARLLRWVATGSRTASPSSGWAARPSPSTGTRASTISSSTPPARRSPPPASPRTTSTPTGSAPPRAACRGCSCRSRCSSRASPSPAWRTCAPPAPRRCARPPTPWPPAPTTSPWPSASRR